MNDLEISKALALAIGWKEEQLQVRTAWSGAAMLAVIPDASSTLRLFDYRDWNVISPIAEKFDAFPRMVSNKLWHSNAFFNSGAYGDTPQKAISLAVIQGAKV